MPYIGNTVQNQGFTPAIDYFSGNGVTVTFTLSRPVVAVAQMIVAVDNVIQNPSSAFTVSGSSITFTSAPLSGTNNIWVEYTSLITTYNAISQDPSVIGDITASGGFLSTGDFGNTYTDGTIVDYVTGNARITTGPIDDMTFYHGGSFGRSEMMKLSYAGNSYVVGNLGVNVTPSAWGSGYKALQVGLNTSLAGNTSASVALLSSNAYYDGSSYKYISTDAASQYQQNTGEHIWRTAASGTAGNTITFSERMRISSAGYVGIGTSSPNYKLEVSGNGTGVNSRIGVTNTATGSTTEFGNDANGGFMATSGAFGNLFYTNGTERMRVPSDGGVRIAMENYGAAPSSTNWGVSLNNTGAGSRFFGQGTGTETQIEFGNRNGTRGSIQTNSTNTLYNTTSDYRLKENVAPMTGALTTISALKPCTYTWKVDGSDGQGFIAHELAEVVPDCVSGEKDAVDENGDIKPQCIDTSFLVATLTAAIQEQQAMIEELKTKVAALEAK